MPAAKPNTWKDPEKNRQKCRIIVRKEPFHPKKITNRLVVSAKKLFATLKKSFNSMEKRSKKKCHTRKRSQEGCKIISFEICPL